MATWIQGKKVSNCAPLPPITKALGQIPLTEDCSEDYSMPKISEHDTRISSTPSHSQGDIGTLVKTGSDSRPPQDSYAPAPHQPKIIRTTPLRGSERILAARPKEDAGIESVASLARQIGVGDSLGTKVREAQSIMTTALEILRKEAQKHVEGWTPGDELIKDALKRGFRDYHYHSPLSGELFFLFDQFRDMVNDEAEELGVTGKKKPKKTETRERQANPQMAARRLLRAMELAREAQELASEIPSERVSDLSVAASSAADELGSLGTNEESVAKGLKGKAKIEGALSAAQRIEDAHEEIFQMYLKSVLDGKDDRAGSIISERSAEIEQWFKDNQSLIRAGRAQVEQALATYVSFWLAEQRGESFVRFGFSSRALRAALAEVRSSAKSAEEAKEIEAALKRLVYELAWSSPGETGDSNALRQTDYERFERSAGKAILESAQRFRDSIVDGTAEGAPASDEERRNAADAFHGLFVQYAMYAATAHPGRELRDILAEEGLEPLITRSIYQNARLASEFGMGAMAMLRNFFAKDVSPRPIPDIADLLPANFRAAPKPAQQNGEERFVEYQDGDSLRDFIRRMPFPITKDLAARFYAATGYSFERYMTWGSRRTHSGEMSEAMWSFLINASENETQLRELLRSYPPDEESPQDWRKRIAALGSFEELAAFAANNKPPYSNKPDWERYAAHCEETGAIQEITVEPRTRVALRAMIPGFAFLRDEAAKYGMSVDVVDYSATFNHTARMMRQSAEDGAITVRTPSFMARTAFHNWSLESWARRISAEKLETNVLKSTLQRHRGGHVQQAERWNMHRYIEPLADGDPERERMLTDFGEFLRIVRLVDSAGRVEDQTGGRLSYAQEPIQSRFTIRIEEDLSTYRTADESHFPDDERLFTEVKKEHYRAALEVVGEFIQNLSLLPRNTTILKGDGTEVMVEELRREFAFFTKRENYYRWILKDNSASAYRSGEDRVEIRKFFGELKRWARSTVYNTRIQGTIFTGHGPTRFIAASRLEGHRANYERSALPVLFFDDLIAARKEYGWDTQRIEDLIVMRILAHAATAWGDIGQEEITNPLALERATQDVWPGDIATLPQAALDYVRLEREPLAYRFDGAEAGLRILRRAGGEQGIRQPILAGAGFSVSWEDQWKQRAIERGLCAKASEISAAAMSGYFARATNLHEYSGEALRSEIQAQLSASGWTMPGMNSDETADYLLTHISLFLPTIGVAGETDGANAANGGDERPEMAAARSVVQEYIAPFPQVARQGLRIKTKVPVLEERLRRLASIKSAESGERRLSPYRIFIAARAIIDEYNSQAAEPSPLSNVGDAVLASSGLASQRLEAFARQRGTAADVDLTTARHAYFRLYDDFMRGRDIDEQKMTDALAASARGAAPSEEEVSLLSDFLKHQKATMMAWRSLVRNPRIGLMSWLRRNYSFEDARIDATVFEAFALRFADLRISGSLGANSAAISSELAAQALASDNTAKKQMAAFIRSGFSSWMDKTAARIGEDLHLVEMEIEKIAKTTAEVPQSGRSLLEKATASLGLPDMEFALVNEDRLSLLDEIRGTGAHRGALIKVSQRYRAAAEERIALERKARREQEIAAAEGSLAHATGAAAGLAWRTAEVLSRWRSTPPLEDQSYEELSAMADRIEKEVSRLGPINDAFLPLETAVGSATAVIEGYGAEEEHSALALSLLETGRDLLGRSTLLLAGAFDRAITSMDSIEKKRALAETKKTMIESEQKLAEALSQVQEINVKIDSLLMAAEGLAEQTAKAEDAAKTIAYRLQDGSPSVFFEAVREFPGFRTSSEKIAAAAVEMEKEFASVLGGTDASSPRIVEALDALEEAVLSYDGVDEPSVETASKSLSESAARALDSLKSMRSIAARIKNSGASLDAALVDAKSRLPAATHAVLPEPMAPEGRPENGPSYTFKNNESLKSDPFKKQGALIREMAHSGMVLSWGNASYLLHRRDASNVEVWLRGGCNTSLTVHDVFGKELKLEQGTIDAKLFKASSLQDDHPFAAMTDNLKKAISAQRNESLLISLLTKSSSRALLSDLLVALSRERCADVESALRAVRAWALSRRGAIYDALEEKRAERFFVESRGDMRDPSYTEAVHANIATAYRNVLNHPELGELSIKGGKKDDIFNVDVSKVRARLEHKERAAEELAAGRLTVDHFDPDLGQWQTIDLRARGVSSIDQIDLDGGSIGDDPWSLRLHQIMLTIYSKTEFMDMGWLFNMAMKKMPDLYRFLVDLVMPSARAKAGRPAPMTLADLQRDAVGAFLSIRDGLFAMPEVGRVKESLLTEWINAPLSARNAGDKNAETLMGDAMDVGYDVETTIRAVEKQLKNNIAVRHTLAKAFMISVWKKFHAGPGYKNVLELTDRYMTAVAQCSAENVKKTGDRIEKAYLELRPKILRSNKLLQIATGMHSPEVAAPFAAPDAELASTHLETGKVGSGQTWALTKHMDKDPAGHKPHVAEMIVSLRRLVQLFPEFANAATLFLSAHDAIKPSTSHALARIVRDYEFSRDFKNDAVVESFRKRFRAIYANSAQGIRSSIAGKSAGEISLAAWLTGEESPWEPSPSWDSYSEDEMDCFMQEMKALGIPPSKWKGRKGGNGNSAPPIAGAGSPTGAPPNSGVSGAASTSSATSIGNSPVRMRGLTIGVPNPIVLPGRTITNPMAQPMMISALTFHGLR